jgi:hypothetical protein
MYARVHEYGRRAGKTQTMRDFFYGFPYTYGGFDYSGAAWRRANPALHPQPSRVTTTDRTEVRLKTVIATDGSICTLDDLREFVREAEREGATGDTKVRRDRAGLLIEVIE